MCTNIKEGSDCSSDAFMSGKPEEAKPSAANMCLAGQRAFNRFLFPLLMGSHSTCCYNTKIDKTGLEEGH